MDETDNKYASAINDDTTITTQKAPTRDQARNNKTHTNLLHYLDSNYARGFQLRFDARIKPDKVIDETDSKMAIVSRFKEIFSKIIDEESSSVLYPYLESSSATPVSESTCMLNTYTELKRYVPSLNPPIKDGDISYCQIYVCITITFEDWNSNFLEWTKDKGHNLVFKYVQNEYTTPIGYLLYTHKVSNAPWYQAILSKKSGIPIAYMFHKILGQKTRDRAEAHLEFTSSQHEQIKEFVRIYYSKNTKPPYIPGFLIIFIPDKKYISNKQSKSGVQTTR